MYAPCIPQFKGGRIRGIAVTTPQRVPQLPDVPTLAEADYPDVDVVTWYALMKKCEKMRGRLDGLQYSCRLLC